MIHKWTEVAGRCEYVHVCVLYIPAQLSSTGCSFLNSFSISYI